MFFFHPLFWMLVACAWIFASRRRRMFRHWAAASAAGYPPEGPYGWGTHGYSRDARWGQQPQMPAAPQPLAQPDRTLVESLESRIAELETRLEFAERLMSSRKDEAPKA